MFSKVVGLLRSLGGRITAGVDKNGNRYYRKPDKGKSGSLVEKRWVEFEGDPDPRMIPVEWNSWLSGMRKEAPTPQEIVILEAQRENVRLQVALLRKEEEKQRIRRASQEQSPADEDSPEDMHIIMRQIGLRESGSAKVQTEEPAHSRYTKVRDVKESAEPTTWRPPGKNNK